MVSVAQSKRNAESEQKKSVTENLSLHKKELLRRILGCRQVQETLMLLRASIMLLNTELAYTKAEIHKTYVQGRRKA